MSVTAAAVLEAVNAQHQTDWRLLGRLSGGSQSGAYLIADGDGDRAVLKWSAAPSWAATVLAAAPVVEVARANGWPTPAWLAVGETDHGYPYHVQEYVHGTTQETLSDDWLDLILPVVAGQAGLGREGMRNWSRYDHDVVFDPSNHNRMVVAASGPAGAQLIDAIARFTRDHGDVVLPADDLVHGDLNPENVLIADGRVAALIDVEAVGRGTRLHDLSTMLLYAAIWGDQRLHDRLVASCRSIAGRGWLEVSLSAVAIDLLAFGVRHWPPHDVASACNAAAALISDRT